MVITLVLMAIEPVPTVKLVSGVTSPISPPKLVVPAVATINALAPLIVDAKVMAPVAVLVKVVVSPEVPKVTAPL